MWVVVLTGDDDLPEVIGPFDDAEDAGLFAQGIPPDASFTASIAKVNDPWEYPRDE